MTLLSRLPRGAQLTPESWQRRHQILSWILWVHVPGLLVLGLLGPMPRTEAVALPLVPAAFAVLARVLGSQRARSELTSLGLISTSFVAIELSGGEISWHLHLFPILALVALYQMWTPLLLTIGVVVVHHLTLGLLAPEHVFNTGSGMGSMAMGPGFSSILTMVCLHAGMVVLQVIAILLLWHFAEITEREATESTAQAQLARDEAALREQENVRDEATRASHALEERTARAAAVSRQVESVREGARYAASALSEINDTLGSLAQAVQEISDRSQEAAGSAQTARQTADQASDKVRRLSQSTDEIAQVNQLISQLADQTNLLSLNATIEAARAGEAGRGFAVVAGEVKSLAGETSTSASKVGEVIASIIDETVAVVSSVGTTTDAIETIQGLQVSIAASVEEQSVTLEQVSRQLSNATTAAQDIHSALDELAAIATS